MLTGLFNVPGILAKPNDIWTELGAILAKLSQGYRG